MVSIKILDETGHRLLEVSPEQAVEVVSQETASGKWVFIDGVFIDTVTYDNLKGADEVVITQRLMGG